MRSLCTLTFIILTHVSLIAQGVELDWVKQIGSTFEDNGNSVAIAQDGSIYVAGAFQLTADFDPGPGTHNLTSFGDFDIFLLKMDSLGNLNWVKQMGGAGEDKGITVNIDPSGNIYVTGFIHGTADLNPDTSVFNLTSNGDRDFVALKFDPFGNFLWAKSMGGNGFDQVWRSEVDPFGNLYLAGFFQYTADFDPDTSVYNLTSAGGDDAFVLKLDPLGNFKWAKRIGSSDVDRTFSLATDGFNVYVSGHFTNTVDFDPGSGTHNKTAAGDKDIFIEKLDSAGNFIWVRTMGGSHHDQARAITLDPYGNIYTTGYFEQTVDFDPGTGSQNFTSSGNNDIFIQKLDANGNFQWAKHLGGGGSSRGRCITTDLDGNVYTIGRFMSTFDFDPSDSSSYNLTAAGDYDVFIHKLDTGGNFVWAKHIGGTGSDGGLFLDADESGGVYATGQFSGTADFNPSPNIQKDLTSAGAQDIFILKLTTCEVTGTDTILSCGPYMWMDSITYTANNYSATYLLEGGSINGCDSLVTLHLTIDSIVNGTDVITACGSHTWIDGNTYTTNNDSATYTIVGGAAGGCDSIVELDLTILEEVNYVDSIVACDSYQWINGSTYFEDNNTASITYYGMAANGCDSVITLNLTILDSKISVDTVEACNAYTWIDGNTYNTSNTSATHTLSGSASNGCDSVVTLNLTINQVSDISTNIVNNTTIVANNGNATSYQWLDCDSNYRALSGETSQIFSPTKNGNYAVVINENGCTDTSDCVEINSIGLKDYLTSTFKLYPNPNQGKFTIEFSSVVSDVEILISDVQGRLIQSSKHRKTNKVDLQLRAPQGVYFVELRTPEGIHATSVLIK